MKTREIKDKIRELVKQYYQQKHEKGEFLPGTTPVHYAGRVFDEEEIFNSVEASLEFWLTAGKWCSRFETGFGEFLGLKHAMLVNSGSSANLCALSALTSPKLHSEALKPGDEVITVAAGFPSTIGPIVQNGLVPVFVDVELGTYNAIAERLADAVSNKTKAIMMAHTMGNPFNLQSALEVANQHNLWLIEDNCDALGSRYKGELTGTFGHLSTVSFYPAHHITMGEGGCVLCDSDNLAKLVKSFRDWGRDCYCLGGVNNTCKQRFSQQHGDLPFGYDHKYVYSHIGYNLKLTEMQAAIGCAQLQKLPDFVEARKNNWNYLKSEFRQFEDRFILPRPETESDPSWFGFVLTVREDAGFSREELVSFLDSRRIETRNLFAGNLLRHPAFKDIKHRVAGDLNNSDVITENTFFIGCYPGMTKAHLEYMVEAFREFINKR